ncbi:hypothetical protein MMC07_000555 [Pseudocyphellaria aurata]|nr:hypothetical protein [Pseudocyphellaria aurata]
MDAKVQSRVVTSLELGSGGSGDGYDADQAGKGGTVADAHDMSRMRKAQELRRNFRFWSIVGFVMILQSTWESMLLAASYGLTNGGTGGVIWVTVGVIVGALCMIGSMAEMASMAPTAGGQYHWVSEFAPRSVEKPLSYLVGWCCCLGWVTGNPASAQLTSTLIQGLVLLRNENANIVALWQTALLIMVFIVVAVAFNIFLAGKLPLAEGVFLILHIVGFFAFLIVLWVMSDHAPARQVFTHFSDGGGWGNMGLSCLVGITTPLWCFLGPDAGAHMAEELQDASRVLPSAMVWATFFNGLLGLVMLITLCFCLGDVDAVLNSPTGVPIVQVLYNSTGSMAGTTVLTVVLILLSLVGLITCVAASSRQMWAFARDKGFPFSGFIAFVRPGWDIPINALVVVCALSLLITALNFGSDVALNAIISLSNAALIFSYLASIGCIRLKRWRRQPLLPRRWSLGPLGAPVNDIALVFLLVSFVMSFFPIAPRPSAPEMNWAVLMFGVVVIAASGNYFFSARYRYVAPVVLVKNRLS